MLQYPLASFAQEFEIDAETCVRGLCTSHGLEQQINRQRLLEARQLRGDVRETTVLASARETVIRRSKPRSTAPTRCRPIRLPG